VIDGGNVVNLVSTDGQSYGVIGTTQTPASRSLAMSLFGDASERDFDAQAL
jgi:hypothetical protein